MHNFAIKYAVVNMEKNRLKKAIIDQKEEILSLPSRVRIIERSCYKKLHAHLESTHIKVIKGVRRCGKSILAYQLLKDRAFAYVNFDDEKLATLASEDLNDVLEVFYEVYGDFKYVLLDEIQNIEGWELFVNRLHRQGFNVLVTGSNAHLLSKELSTHLTGRHIALELFPFSFAEFILYHGLNLKNVDRASTKERGLIKKLLQEYIITGGFPEVVRDPANKSSYLQSLYSDILNKDIIIRHKIKFSGTLKDMANSLVSNTSSLISFNKIKNIFKLKSVHTSLNYVSFLEESFLLFLVPRFSYKAKERVIAGRKVYFIDTGLIGALSVDFSRNIGKIYENVVFLELARRRSTEKSEIYYWQDIYRNEVDFAVKKGRKADELIQVCYDLGNYDTKKREVSALIKAGKEMECRTLTIITEDYEGRESSDGENIIFIPLWKWLLKEPE